MVSIMASAAVQGPSSSVLRAQGVRTPHHGWFCKALASGAEGCGLRSEGVRVADTMIKASGAATETLLAARAAVPSTLLWGCRRLFPRQHRRVPLCVHPVCYSTPPDHPA